VREHIHWLQEALSRVAGRVVQHAAFAARGLCPRATHLRLRQKRIRYVLQVSYVVKL